MVCMPAAQGSFSRTWQFCLLQGVILRTAVCTRQALFQLSLLCCSCLLDTALDLQMSEPLCEKKLQGDMAGTDCMSF